MVREPSAPLPFLLFPARPSLLSPFPLAFPYRRGAEASFNVVRSPRRSDPVEAMRDSIRPSIPPNNAIRHRLDPFLASSSAMRGLDPSIYFIKTHVSNKSTYNANQGRRPIPLDTPLAKDPSVHSRLSRQIKMRYESTDNAIGHRVIPLSIRLRRGRFDLVVHTF